MSRRISNLVCSKTLPVLENDGSCAAASGCSPQHSTAQHSIKPWAVCIYFPADCRSSLEELVLDERGNLRSNRIENLMREGSKSMAYDPSTLWQVCPTPVPQSAGLAM